MSFLTKTWERLCNPEYRRAFVASQLNIGIPFQIRALMQQRGLTQADLANLTGIRQPTISNLTRPGKVEPNIKTLRRLAEAFDCALMVRFVPFSELVRSADRFSPDTFTAVPFAQDSIAEDSSAKLALDGEATPLLGWTNGDTTAANCDPQRKPVENERMIYRFSPGTTPRKAA